MAPSLIKTLTIRSLKSIRSADGEFAIVPLADFAQAISVQPPGKIRFYALLLVTDNGGTLTVDDKVYNLSRGELHFVHYHQMLRIESSLKLAGTVLLFTRSFYNLIYTGNRKIRNDTAFSGLPAFVRLPRNEIASFQATVHEIRREFSTSGILTRELICLQLKVLMLKYIRRTDDVGYIDFKTSHKNSYVEQFKDLIEKHFKDLKRTSGYAEKLGISANYLNALVKEKMEMSAENFIQHRVILEAQRLLLNTDLSVTEIAFELGFSDKSHFGKYFKKITEESPNLYRKKFQEQN